ncbi:MAG: nucleotidyltransferase domain-containing protein [Christensenellales bacterium]|jgi:hypothetical protein
MDPLIKQANELLQNQPFEYAFCGGFAIDLFLGFESRKHGDIDIHAYWKDRDIIIEYMLSLGFNVCEMLGGGKAHRITDIGKQLLVKRNIFCFKDGCELVQLSETSQEDVYLINFQHIGQTKLDFIEFLFNSRTDSHFLYARNHDIRRPLSKAVLTAGDMPYLAPEICLLYKSTDIQREGYKHDYDMAMSKMTNEQKAWLNHALASLYPEGHMWIV